MNFLASEHGTGMQTVTESEFAAWADRVGLTLPKQREALRLIYVHGMSINAAARSLIMSPSTVSRAKRRYVFGCCPCCGQPIPVARP